jgi:hypothetical protein
MLQLKRLFRSLPIVFLALAVGGTALAQSTAPQKDGKDPVDIARAANRNKLLPKAPPAAIGTPPIITRRGSSIAGSSVPSKARRNSASPRSR